MIYGKCSADLNRLMCIMKSSLYIHMDKRGTGHINRVYREGAGMAKAEFGIIEDIMETREYSYNPEKYHCVSIDDEVYIEDWWDKLVLLKTYFHNLNRPDFGLARWGITLIPPESLPAFQEIVMADGRMNRDEQLVALADKIGEAICKEKYMIHFGV